MNNLGYVYLKSEDWINFFQEIEHWQEKDSRKQIVISKNNTYAFISSSEATKETKKLTLNEIIYITSHVFTEKQTLTRDCAEARKTLINGLTKIIEIREKKYHQLNLICRLFARLFGFQSQQDGLLKTTEDFKGRLENQLNWIKKEKQRTAEEEIKQEEKRKKLAEKAEYERICRLETLNQFEKEFIQEDFDIQTFDLTQFNIFLGQELETCLDRIAEKKLIFTEEKMTTFFILYEKTAERYLAKNQFKKAVSIRLKACNTLSPCSKFSSFADTLQKTNDFFDVFINALGAGTLKHHVLRGRVFAVKDHSIFRLEGRLTHFARSRLDGLIAFLSTQSDSLEISPFKKIKVKKIWDFSPPKDNNPANFRSIITESEFTHINFEGIGDLLVGEKNHYCQHTRFIIQSNPLISTNKAPELFYSMLAFMGLGEIAHAERSVDIDRIKIFQLFRAYFPKEIYPFERAQDPFEIPLNDLKTRMIQSVSNYERSKANKIFHSLDSLVPQEVYKNFNIWSVKDFSHQMKAEGANYLITGVGCIGFNPWAKNDDDVQVKMQFETATNHIAKILKVGIFSTLDRRILGIAHEGISSHQDVECGGGDSVFCRLLISPWAKKVSIKKIFFSGHIQIIFDLSLLDRVGYGFIYDHYGTKTASPQNNFSFPYKERQNLINLTKELSSPSSAQWYNEVCIKHRISPEYILGLQVPTEEKKQILLETLRKKDLIQVIDGKECWEGNPIETFIRVGDTFKDHL